VRLNWNEIRARAAEFAREWADAHYEKGETQSFYNDFFNVFGVQRRRVAVFEQQVKKLDNKQGFIDLFWPSVLLVEQKSAGRDLGSALAQAQEYCLGLKPNEFPRYILLSDFQTFELYDLTERTEVKSALAELPKKVEAFGFILGIQKRTFKDQDPVNIAASELMGKVHDALEESGYRGSDLERFLVRLLFCLFADDTGIFDRGIFETLLRDRTAKDGSDLGSWITHLFQVLDTPVDDRSKSLDEDLAAFPYINGDLFRNNLRIPSFDSKMRQRIIEACEFSWDAVSPAIFGSLFQSVMNRAERRKLGAHYTTEKNIMKVIGPLFLDDLHEEFERLKARKDNRRKGELEAFQRRLGTLTFLDPACGCGNFLVIAYRELRELEIEVLRELRPDTQQVLDVSALSVVDVDQFYGIEIGEFPARIAEVAMWMMDHIMNNRLSLEFGQVFLRIPLQKSPHIRCADALELDWAGLLQPEQCSYVFGNPPFVGAKFQSQKQREQVRNIARLGGSGGTLDFVAAWFIKAGGYVRDSKARIAFVATNSITQGEQVAQLWPILFDRYHLEIAFAHRTFAWGSEARGVAHVHVVIVGLARSDMEPAVKRLFSYSDIKGDPTESRHKALTAYLFGADEARNRHLVVKEESRPINGLLRLIIGSKPIDNGHYIFTKDEKDAFLAREPGAAKFLRPFIGAQEYINGGQRWILALHNASPADLRAMPEVAARMAVVKAYRKASKSKPTQALGDMPALYHVNVLPTAPFLVIPEVSSERREYAPIGWLEPPVIPSNKVRILENAPVWIFSLLTSAAHMTWLRYIGGRLKSDFQYGIGVVYNTFPMPQLTDADRAKLDATGQAVLDARAQYPDATPADLYDPDTMPPVLHKAHQANDKAVDRLYRKSPFTSERERVEHLFALYEQMVAPVEAAANVKPKKRRH